MVLPINNPQSGLLPTGIAPTQVENNVPQLGTPIPTGQPQMNIADIESAALAGGKTQADIDAAKTAAGVPQIPTVTPIQPPQPQPKAKDGEVQPPMPSQQNVDGALSQLMTGNSMNIPKETLQLAQFRKTRLDLMLGKTPKDIAALLFRGRITAGDKVMSDLRTYNPQLFGQVLEEVKKEKDLDKINTLGRNIYYKISEGKGPTGLITQQGQEVESDPMQKINDDMVNTVKSVFGANADAMMPMAQQMLGGDPLMQQAQSQFASATAKRKQLERSIANTEEDVRKMLGSEVPESFASAYIARQTKDLTKQRQVYKDIEETELAQINAQKEDMKMRISAMQFVPASKYNPAGYFDKMTGTFTPLQTGRGFGGGGGGGGLGGLTPQQAAQLSPLAQAYLNGTITFKDMTATDRSKVAAELAQAGVQPVNAKVADMASQVLKAIKSLETMKGMSGAIGAKGASSLFGLKDKPIAGSAAASYLIELDRLKGMLTLPMLENLRGLGAMSDREFKTMQSAATSLNTDMSESAYLAELGRVKKVMNDMVERVNKQQGIGQTPAETPVQPQANSNIPNYIQSLGIKQ